MRLFILLVFTIFCHSLTAQILTQNASELAPTEEYTNVKTVTLHDDENTTVYMIFVKQAVRKHLHQYHTEVITVIAGRGRMFLGGEYFNIKKGDHIIVPPNTPHAVITTSGRPLQVLSIQTPQFMGQDRTILAEDTPEAATTKPKKKQKRKKKKKVNDIPEFEGEYD